MLMVILGVYNPSYAKYLDQVARNILVNSLVLEWMAWVYDVAIGIYKF